MKNMIRGGLAALIVAAILTKAHTVLAFCIDFAGLGLCEDECAWWLPICGWF